MFEDLSPRETSEYHKVNELMAMLSACKIDCPNEDNFQFVSLYSGFINLKVKFLARRRF